MNVVGIPSVNYELGIPGGVDFSDTSPTEKDTIQICADVVNNGLGMVPATMLSFFAGDPEVDGIFLGNDFLEGLGAEGDSAQGCIDWDTTNFIGDVNIYAQVDYWDLMDESNENNNIVSETISVLSRPDLTISTIDIPDLTVGETVTGTITLLNSRTECGRQLNHCYL